MTSQPNRLAGSGKTSAGLLLFRRRPYLEVFLAHPGGPFWVHRQIGAWTIPKGAVNEGEPMLDAARREFREETGLDCHGPYLPLGSVRQRAGKVVFAWAWEGDADSSMVESNLATAEWPRNSGKTIEYPEIDYCAWFDPAEARQRLNPAQAAFIDRLEGLLRNP